MTRKRRKADSVPGPDPAAPQQPEILDIPPPPEEPGALRDWIRTYAGLNIPDIPVCEGHSAPWDWFQAIHFDRPQAALIIGARGSGKSYLSALDTHIASLRHPNLSTRILGGSKAQSSQIYHALRDIADRLPSAGDPDQPAGLKELRKEQALYENGSDVAILAASSRSVRGPHVASLKLDEVDEIDVEIRDAAIGMCMARHGMDASIVMTSTWHRPHGPISKLIDRGNQGHFPIYTTCVFEVLERCPDSRSGERLENCHECVLQPYCHDVRDGDTPKAKRSNGHYSIDALIQKIKLAGKGVFEADYLCKGPRADALWFPTFSLAEHVSGAIELDPMLPTYLAIDPGVTTGAVYFQHRHDANDPGNDEVIVLDDFLSSGSTAEQNARDILKRQEDLFKQRRIREIFLDPATRARSSTGSAVLDEYKRGGIESASYWPGSRVADSLALLESFVRPAQGPPRLKIHERCKWLIEAFQNYRRLKRGGQFEDRPLDPQHPFEDMIDALRGGILAMYPQGRLAPGSPKARVPGRKVL